MLNRLQAGQPRISNPVLPQHMRPKPLLNKQNQLAPNNFINQQQKSRPLISPRGQYSERQSQQFQGRNSTQMHSHRMLDRHTTEQVCQNHPNKKAEHSVLVEGGEEMYCGRCAAQLVTQGFDIRPLNEGSLQESKRESLPHLPEYESEPMYRQILDILRMCNSVKKEHRASIEQFSRLEEHYQQQINLTSVFYDNLIDILEAMKRDHLEDLHHDRSKKTQEAYIANDHLEENIAEIQAITSDIESNLEEVLQEIAQTGQRRECQESLQHYRQKLTLWRHQAEERLEILKDVPEYSKPMMDLMMDNFEQHLQKMWDEEGSGRPAEGHELMGREREQNTVQNMQHHPITVKNIHQILPRGLNNEANQNKGAFRNLEDEEEEEEYLEERKSPNFKRI